VRRFTLPRTPFEDLVDGVEMDLDRQRYQSFEELYEYCWRVASTVGLICIEIFGVHGDRAREYAVNLGVALQLTNILRTWRATSGTAVSICRSTTSPVRVHRGRSPGRPRDRPRARPAGVRASRAKTSTGARPRLGPTARAGGWWRPRSWRPSIVICSRASNEGGTTYSRRVSACPGRVRPGSRLASGRAAGPMAAPDVIVVGAGFAG
jgi:hypothetical protein